VKKVERGILLNSVNVQSNILKISASTDIKFADTRSFDTKYEKTFKQKSFKEYMNSANDKYETQNMQKNISNRRDSKYNVSQSCENLNNSKISRDKKYSEDKKTEKLDNENKNAKKAAEYDEKTEGKVSKKDIFEEEILEKTGINRSQLQYILAALGINERLLMDNEIRQQLIDTINYAVLSSESTVEAVNMLAELANSILPADSGMLQGDLHVQADNVQDSNVQNLLLANPASDLENDAAGVQSMEDITIDQNEAKSKLEQLMQELMQQGVKTVDSKAGEIDSYVDFEDKPADNEEENIILHQQNENIENEAEIDSYFSVRTELDESAKNENEMLMHSEETLENIEIKDSALIEQDMKFSQEQNNANSTGFNYSASVKSISTAETSNTSGASATSTAVREHLFQQIMDKAKVMVDGGKSEMVLDLQPENFGKLSLKVVTERGIVLAKIVTENEQVKEVLETNMQLLKDSLQNQGLTVGEISVSVGNRHGSQLEDREMLYQEKGNKNLGLKTAALNNPSAYVQNELAPDTQNGYLWSESSIDLMA